jgi:type II secretory pathway pseudopilin PulG
MTLIEAMMSMVVLLIGAAGIMSAQLMVVRNNTLGRRMAQASSLVADFQENAALWAYDDSRLDVFDTATETTAKEIEEKWIMWEGGEDPYYTAQYSDLADDTNAVKPDALGAGYTGKKGDFDGDGKQELVRYWNVISLDLQKNGTADGKLIMIIVRWREPGFGYRQIYSSMFKRNPAKVF